MVDLRSDTNIYKCTYHELVIWVKELLWAVQRFRELEELNHIQAGKIMELQFDLTQQKTIMFEDTMETVMKEYGIVQSDVVSNEEFQARRLKRGGGGPGNGRGKDGDWLSPMVWGTEFLARPRIPNGMNPRWLLAKFMMAGIRDGMVLVIPMRGDEPIQDDHSWMWVDPVAFSKYFELMGILLEPESTDE